MSYKQKPKENPIEPAPQSPVEQPQNGMDRRVRYGLIGAGGAILLAAALYGGCRACKPAPTFTPTPTYTAVPTATATPIPTYVPLTPTLEAKVKGHKVTPTPSAHSKSKYDAGKATYDGKKKAVTVQKKVTGDVKKIPGAKKSPTALNLEGKVEGVD